MIGSNSMITSEGKNENDACAIIGDDVVGFIHRMGMDWHCPCSGVCDHTIIHITTYPLHRQSHYDLHGYLYVTPARVSLGLSNADTQEKMNAQDDMQQLLI